MCIREEEERLFGEALDWWPAINASGAWKPEMSVPLNIFFLP